MARRRAGDEWCELARYEDRPPVLADAISDQPLGLAKAVDLGRIDETAARIDKRLVSLEHGRVVRPVAPAVRADPDGGNLGARLAEGAERRLLHHACPTLRSADLRRPRMGWSSVSYGSKAVARTRPESGHPEPSLGSATLR